MQSGPPRTVRCLGEPALILAEHDRAAHVHLATRLAELLQLPLGDEWIDSSPATAGGYWVPYQSISCARAVACGIRCVDDLFGGVVPELYMGTKVITHGLIAAAAKSPPGWCETFADAVHDVVLRGYSVFDRDDLVRAGNALLAEGDLRIKQPHGVGGQGQRLITNPEQLASCLSPAASENLARDGLVLEEQLADVVTLSVGQILLGGVCTSYFGTQQCTPNNRGETAYGGSELCCVRGGFDALDRVDVDASTRIAIKQARTYHAAALRCFPGLILSRANYDVAQGTDAQGRWRSGVLEQSWRAGGASAAEIEAVAILLREPHRQSVKVRTVERYGHATAPSDAIVLYHGNDSRNGPLLKYAEVIPDAAA